MPSRKSQMLREIYSRDARSLRHAAIAAAHLKETTMKTFPAIFTVLRIALGFALSAGPASAQSFCTCDGTGNVLTFSNKAFMPTNGKPALNDRALRAYAAEGSSVAGPNSPHATGGGSAGYNEMLLNF
jgi:hypothetical protein